MLSEKIPIASIARVVGVSERRLQTYADNRYESLEKQAVAEEKGSMTIPCDEMCFFADSEKDNYRIWPATDADTRRIVGTHIGDRGEKGAGSLWNSLSPAYRQYAVIYTYFWKSYESVLPSERHKAVPKSSGKTSYIERLNNTVRQRVSRLVRKTLSFLKKPENHTGVTWLFIHHYN